MARLASTVAGTPHSGIRVMADLARFVPDVLNLGVGDPNFVTPPHIIEAAAQAARDGFTKYTPSDGYVTLRELLAAKVTSRNGIDASVEQVVVTTRRLRRPLHEPARAPRSRRRDPPPRSGLGELPADGARAEREARLLPARSRPRLGTRSRRLESLVGARSKAIVLNSPGNPTGAVYDADVLAGVLELARRQGPLGDLGRVLRRDRLRGRAREHGDGRRRRPSPHRVHVLEVLCDDGLAARIRGRSARGGARAREGAGARRRQRVEHLPEGRRGSARRAAGLRRDDARGLPGSPRPRDDRARRGRRRLRSPSRRLLPHGRCLACRRLAPVREAAAPGGAGLGRPRERVRATRARAGFASPSASTRRCCARVWQGSRGR